MIRELLAKQKRLNSKLDLRHLSPPKDRWLLADKNLIPVVDSFTAAFEAIRMRRDAEDVVVFKNTDRRLVFRFVGLRDGVKTDFVAKVFLLNTVRHRVKAYRYGLDEAANLLLASDRGISVPAIYAAGSRGGGWGLPTANFLILEYLNGFTVIRCLFENAQGDQSRLGTVLNKTVPVFVSLYKGGCNHIDLNCGSILIDTETNSPPMLLDLHYAKFFSDPSLKVLAFETAYFLTSCSTWINQQMSDAWVAELLDRIEVYDRNQRQMFNDTVKSYLCASLSRKQRQKI